MDGRWKSPALDIAGRDWKFPRQEVPKARSAWIPKWPCERRGHFPVHCCERWPAQLPISAEPFILWIWHHLCSAKPSDCAGPRPVPVPCDICVCATPTPMPIQFPLFMVFTLWALPTCFSTCHTNTTVCKTMQDMDFGTYPCLFVFVDCDHHAKDSLRWWQSDFPKQRSKTSHTQCIKYVLRKRGKKTGLRGAWALVRFGLLTVFFKRGFCNLDSGGGVWGRVGEGLGKG